MSNNSLNLKLISDKDREVYEIVNYVFIASAISLFGIVANVMNILVFYKQGFSNTTNISFFALALSDLSALVTLLWLCVCVNPFFLHSDAPLVIPEVRYLTGSLPHACFARTTGWITVFLTAERCLCITMPLKIKRIITPGRTKGIIVVIFLVVLSALVPEYSTMYMKWKFYPAKNRTLLGLAVTYNRKSLEGLSYILYSFLGSASFIAVIAFTVTLVVKLKEKSKFRKEVNMDATQNEMISSRDRKTVSMVIMIATVLIVCYTPGAAVSMVTFIIPEMNPVGRLKNEFFVFWTFAFNFHAINSSVNIFLYYKMSTKYRETFLAVIGIMGTKSSLASSQRPGVTG